MLSLHSPVANDSRYKENKTPQHDGFGDSYPPVNITALVDKLLDDAVSSHTSDATVKVTPRNSIMTHEESAIRTSLANFSFNSVSMQRPSISEDTLARARQFDALPPSPKSQPLSPLPIILSEEGSSYFEQQLQGLHLPTDTDLDPLEPLPYYEQEDERGRSHYQLAPDSASDKRDVPQNVGYFRESLKRLAHSSHPTILDSSSSRRSPSPASSIASTDSIIRPAHLRSRSASHSMSITTRQRHSRRDRRDSIASFAGFKDVIPNLAPTAVAPTLSNASVEVLHEGANTRFVDISTPSIMASEERFFETWPEHPVEISSPTKTASQLEAPPTSAKMAKGASDPGCFSQNISRQLPAVPFFFPSQPCSPWESQPPSRQTSSRYNHDKSVRDSVHLEGTEEADANPLYVLMSTSTEPDIKDAWLRAGMILLPPKATLPDMNMMKEESTWIRGHAFQETQKDSGLWSSLGYDWNASIDGDLVELKNRVPAIRTRASYIALNSSKQPKLSHRASNMSFQAGSIPFPSSHPDSEEEDELPNRGTLSGRSVSTSTRNAPLATRTLRIKSEMTVYRHTQSFGSNMSLHTKAQQHAQHPPTLRQRLSASKLRPRWLQRASFNRSSAFPIAEGAESAKTQPSSPVLERIRLISVDEEVWAWTGRLQEPHTLPLNDLENTVQLSFIKEREVPNMRNLHADLAFFLDPAYDDGNRIPLEESIKEIATLSHDFANHFIYVKGFEMYTAQRIRRGILDKIWGDMVELYEASSRLFQMVENVVMGFVHYKVYELSIKPIFNIENSRINEILAHYRESYDLEHFAVSSRVDCSRAVSILGKLVEKSNPNDFISPAASEQLYRSAVDITNHVTFIDNLLEAGTPFDVITTVRLTIDELVKSCDGCVGSRMTGTDELLPLLAYTIVHSGLQDLESLLFYIKNFTQSSLGPEYDWSLVTFQAAIAYLRTDPLGTGAHSTSTSPVSVHVRRPSPLYRRHTDDLRSPSTARKQLSPYLLRNNSSSKLPIELNPHSIASKSTSSLVELDDSSFYGHRALAVPVDTNNLSNSSSRPRRLSNSSSQSALLSDGSNMHDIQQKTYINLSDPDEFGVRNHRCSIDSSIPFDSASIASSTNSDHGSSETHPASELQIRPQIVLRGHTRMGGKSRTQDGSESMNRSLSSHQPTRHLGGSIDMRRGRSDSHTLPAKRSSIDSWSLFRAPAASTDKALVASPQTSSPTGSFSAGPPSTDEDWFGWTRRRLSSVTSLGSFNSSDLLQQRKLVDNAADKTLNRTYSLDDSALESTSTYSHHAQMRNGTRARPLSTISISSSISDSSSHVDDATSPTLGGASLAGSRRRRRSGRLRRDLLASSSISALPPHVDLSTAGFTMPSGVNGFRPMHSPIKEGYSTPNSTS